MPIYEYNCRTCGKTFDALRTFNDADKQLTCTCCKSTDTQRVISTFFSHTTGSSKVNATTGGGGCGGCSGGNCGSCSH